MHSGGPGESVLSDLPLAVDGKGTVYFPGTGIAGPLRAWWRRADPDLVDAVWGRVESEPGSRKGWASILLVHDAPLIERLADKIDLDLAQHVSISRKTGTAAGTLKFDRELVPVQARFRLSLELHRPERAYGPCKIDDDRWDRIQALAARHAWRTSRMASSVSARTSPGGRGKLHLEDAKISSRDLAGGILDTLRNELESEPESKDIDGFFGEIRAIRPKTRLIELKLECQPVAPVMQRHEAEGATVDMLPAVAIEGDKRKPFLSGTGIKGAFRAQSERILRTVLCQEDLEKSPLDLVAALYGAKAEKTDRGRMRHSNATTLATSSQGVGR